MRVVVTGATGNVGTSVLQTLIGEERVESIVGIARRRPDWRPDRVEWIEADVGREPLEQHLRGADALIHLAWAIQPSRDEVETRQINVEGSERVFEAAARAGVPAVVHASSVGAYSPRDGSGDPVDESWPVGGIESSFYSRHKAMVETILDRFEADNPAIRVVRLRPALIFKGDAGSEIRRLFGGPLVPSRLLRPGSLPLMPWIAGMRTQAVHTDDVAEAYRLAAIGECRGAFNIAADPPLDADTVAEALGSRVIELPKRAVRALTQASWDLRLQPTPPGWVDMGVDSPLMSTVRARDELEWKPQRTAGDALRAVLEGMAESAGEATPPLDPDAGGPARVREWLSGIGARNP